MRTSVCFVLSLACTLGCLLSGPTAAQTCTVRPDGTGDYPTIQAAIDAGAEEILLTNGTFSGPGNRSIDFGGRDLIIRSENRNPRDCIIDCAGVGRGFDFHSGEGPSARVEAVTITNGFLASEHGAGIRCLGASPTIAGCWIMHNRTTGTGVGGGIFSYDGGPIIQDCRILANEAKHGGGLYITGNAGATITDCVISRNVASNCAGAILLSSQTSEVTELHGCRIFGNRASQRGGAIYCLNDDASRIIHCTITSNEGGLSPIYVYDGGTPHLEYSIVSTGQGQPILCDDGDDPVNPSIRCCNLIALERIEFCGTDEGCNISLDPGFTDADADDYTLRPDSPCRAGGHPNALCATMEWIGAVEATTQAVTEPSTWGRIKTRFE